MKKKHLSFYRLMYMVYSRLNFHFRFRPFFLNWVHLYTPAHTSAMTSFSDYFTDSKLRYSSDGPMYCMHKSKAPHSTMVLYSEKIREPLVALIVQNNNGPAQRPRVRLRRNLQATSLWRLWHGILFWFHTGSVGGTPCDPSVVVVRRWPILWFHVISLASRPLR